MENRAWTVRRPEWVAPSQRQVSDLWWLAVRLTERRGDGPRVVDESYAWASGVQDALGWVEGGLPSPTCGFDAQPVTRTDAAREADLAAEWGKQCEAAGETLRMHVQWALGVVSTLLWLLDRAEVPMRLPIRTADGAPAEPADLILAAAEEFGPPATDEDRRRLHEWSIGEARRSRELVAAIDDTYERMLTTRSG
jgi:hypothetical protein